MSFTMNQTTAILTNPQPCYLVLRTNFDSTFEAQTANYLGTIETLRITHQAFDSIETAIQFASDSVKSGEHDNLTVVYYQNRSNLYLSNVITHMACLYWDSVHHMVAEVTYPLAIAA
jgi:hypothetical protein